MGEIILLWALTNLLASTPPVSFHPTEAACLKVKKARNLSSLECIPGQYVLPPSAPALPAAPTSAPLQPFPKSK